MKKFLTILKMLFSVTDEVDDEPRIIVHTDRDENGHMITKYKRYDKHNNILYTYNTYGDLMTNKHSEIKRIGNKLINLNIPDLILFNN